MLWPDPLLLIGRASSDTRPTKESIRNVSCEFFTEHYLPTNEFTERTFFSIPILVFTVQETTVVTLTMLLPPIISRQRTGMAVDLVHTQERGGKAWDYYVSCGPTALSGFSSLYIQITPAGSAFIVLFGPK
jgi:hypothetical protein